MKIKINENYKSLVDNYLFLEIAKRNNYSYCSANPDNALNEIRIWIGEVTLSL
ncbi:MAG: hypothetical protein HUJ51_02825 [Eggerthellaceae bacterium]|nr:hypothetical protein [Eggerthellaceae bacterium]